MIENILRRADLFDFGVVHDDHIVGEFESFFLIVGDENGGQLDLLVKMPEPAPALHVRDVDVHIVEGLKRRARRNHRSLQGELRRF